MKWETSEGSDGFKYCCCYGDHVDVVQDYSYLKFKDKKAMAILTEDQKQEDFNRMMDEYTKGMEEYHKRIEAHNTPILEWIIKEKGEDWYAELAQLIEESRIHGEFEIVKKPFGNKQEASELIEWEWVDQRSLGDSGDSFEGFVTVKISDDRFLRMPFSM